MVSFIIISIVSCTSVLMNLCIIFSLTVVSFFVIVLTVTNKLSICSFCLVFCSICSFLCCVSIVVLFFVNCFLLEHAEKVIIEIITKFSPKTLYIKARAFFVSEVIVTMYVIKVYIVLLCKAHH